MKKIFFASLFLFYVVIGKAQKTENVVLITLDGFRWQEVFGGADSTILNSPIFNKDIEGTTSKFYSSTSIERRKKLFPFLWSEFASKGQIHGNRNLGSKVNVKNPYQFSYPGYNEILTGIPDTLVNSNDKIYNNNISFLEYLQKSNKFFNKIAAFTTWDVFPYIINDKRSQLYINSGFDAFNFKSQGFDILNDLQTLSAKPLDVRLDINTFLAAKEYVKNFKPKVLYISFDETDDYAHAGLYDQYLKMGHSIDKMIENLWNYYQSQPEYKNKTTFFITCDHGRGDLIKSQWTSHGSEVKESGEIWYAIMGPETKAKGEVKNEEQVYQYQFANTIMNLLGVQKMQNAGPAIDLN